MIAPQDYKIGHEGLELPEGLEIGEKHCENTKKPVSWVNPTPAQGDNNI